MFSSTVTVLLAEFMYVSSESDLMNSATAWQHNRYSFWNTQRVITNTDFVQGLSLVVCGYYNLAQGFCKPKKIKKIKTVAVVIV